MEWPSNMKNNSNNKHFISFIVDCFTFETAGANPKVLQFFQMVLWIQLILQMVEYNSCVTCALSHIANANFLEIMSIQLVQSHSANVKEIARYGCAETQWKSIVLILKWIDQIVDHTQLFQHKHFDTINTHSCLFVCCCCPSLDHGAAHKIRKKTVNNKLQQNCVMCVCVLTCASQKPRALSS